MIICAHLVLHTLINFIASYLYEDVLLRREGVAINGDEEVLPDGILDVERGREGRRDRAQVLVLLAQAPGKRELEVRLFTGRLKGVIHIMRRSI